MNDKVKYLNRAKNCVSMAIQELEKANIVMVNDKCWISAMTAANNLHLAYGNLKESIKEETNEESNN